MKKKMWIWFVAILIIGFAVRLVGIKETPVGLNADEAYAGYEAWAIGEEGNDSHGYTNPVYFVSWGSGMNVLYSYLSVPAVKVFGLNTFSLRITQAVLGCATLVIMFFIARKFLDEKKSLILLFLLAICPWHVMLSRWGLESNILPFCLSMGILGVVYGLEKKPWLLVAALGFGLSLYSYAVAWMIVPFLVAGVAWHGIRTKKITWNKWSVMSGGLLVLLGLPLVLFLAVNAGILPEIRTAFVSMPKMPRFGSGGYDLNIFKHIVDFLGVIFGITPDKYNSMVGYGLFFLFSGPLMVYGVMVSAKGFVTDIRRKKWSIYSVIGLWVVACIPVCLFITDVNATRINAVLLPLFMTIVVAIIELTKGGFLKKFLPVVLATYALNFALFYIDYQTNKAWNFPEITEAVEYTNRAEGEVYFDGQNFAQILVAVRPTIGSEPAIRNNPGAVWVDGRVDVRQIGRYHLQVTVEDEIDVGGIYIIEAGNGKFEEKLVEYGFSVMTETVDKKVLRR